MKRGGPLRRSRMVRRVPRRIALQTADETAFISWIHGQECIGLVAFAGHVCTWQIEQSHGPAMKMGGKSAPMESWAACTGLHRAWEGHASPFKGWTKAGRRAFSALASAHTRNAFFALDGEPQT